MFVGTVFFPSGGAVSRDPCGYSVGNLSDALLGVKCDVARIASVQPSSVGVSDTHPKRGCISAASLLDVERNANSGGAAECATLAAGQPVFAHINTRTTHVGGSRRALAATGTVDSVSPLVGAVFSVVPTGADIEALSAPASANVLLAIQAALTAAAATSLASFTTFYNSWTRTNDVAAFSDTASGLGGTSLAVGSISGDVGPAQLSAGAVGGIAAGCAALLIAGLAALALWQRRRAAAPNSLLVADQVLPRTEIAAATQ